MRLVGRIESKHSRIGSVVVDARGKVIGSVVGAELTDEGSIVDVEVTDSEITALIEGATVKHLSLANNWVPFALRKEKGPSLLLDRGLGPTNVVADIRLVTEHEDLARLLLTAEEARILAYQLIRLADMANLPSIVYIQPPEMLH